MMTTLEDVLRGVGALNWRHALYVSTSDGWSESTLCAVLDPDDCEDADETPLFAKENGLQYMLGISTVQDILINAQLQRPEADIDDFLEALVYYCENDAFKIF